MSHPINDLEEAIHLDDEYAWGFYENFRIPAYDAAIRTGVDHERALKLSAATAYEILFNVFKYDITKNSFMEKYAIKDLEYLTGQVKLIFDILSQI